MGLIIYLAIWNGFYIHEQMALEHTVSKQNTNLILCILDDLMVWYSDHIKTI